MCSDLCLAYIRTTMASSRHVSQKHRPEWKNVNNNYQSRMVTPVIENIKNTWKTKILTKRSKQSQILDTKSRIFTRETSGLWTWWYWKTIRLHKSIMGSPFIPAVQKHTRQCRLVLCVVRVWRCLIEVQVDSTAGKRHHEYAWLCCFLLSLWNTLGFNQATVKPPLPIITFDIVDIVELAFPRL